MATAWPMSTSPPCSRSISRTDASPPSPPCSRPGRFGALELDEDDCVTAFREKPQDEAGWINGGFFVLEPAALDLIENDTTVWEQEPLERLVAENQLRAHRHRGFWQPVDTLRDKRYLEKLWINQTAPWKTWP